MRQYTYAWTKNASIQSGDGFSFPREITLLLDSGRNGRREREKDRDEYVYNIQVPLG